jgi:hypothetical protein
MAWTDFYVDSGGSNINAGNVINAAASVTVTAGGWSTATNVFTAPSGTPFSGITDNVDWASIYNDGATVGVFTGLITAHTNTTITISATVRMGTPPTTNASTRSCKVGGSWLNTAIWASAAVLGAGTVGVATRINYQAATYANTTTNRIVAVVGTAAFPIWHRGYKTTPGDMDGRPTTARVAGTDIPLITWTTQAGNFNGNFNQFSSMAFSATTNTAAVIGVAGTDCKFHRCEFTSTNAAAGGVAFRTTAARTMCSCCYFKATTSGQAAVRANSGGSTYLSCWIEGGLAGVETDNSSTHLIGCLIRNAATYGFSAIAASGTLMAIIGCTIDNPGTDGMRFAVTTNQATIANNIITNCPGVGINNSSGTNNDRFLRVANLFFNCGTNESGLGDDTAFDTQTDASTPYLVAGSDYTTKATSNARRNATPGLFEGPSLVETTYLDIGAVQHPDPEVGYPFGG